jgi:UDP-2,3-diacylglucosamine pyrophosphatase LpxH
VITRIRSERMVVISDLHLGNPFSQAKRQVIPFLKWADKQGFDICINGDGLDIAQASFNKIAFEVPELFRLLGEMRRRGREIFYITGNHDIALEHFLEDWGLMKVSPFLNVDSADYRIRIEHGHMYDPFFISFPKTYEFLTHFAGLILKIHPQLYRLWIAFERFASKVRSRKTGIIGEPPSFQSSALELSRRGFDAIIFGHTHHPGMTTLENGAKYFNSGSWMLTPYYVQIEKGVVSLQPWKKI